MAEDKQQRDIQLAAPHQGWDLWRNNRGALTDRHGRLVRYGLGHEHPDRKDGTDLLSSDLIGIRPVIIQPDMVGKLIGQFVAVEVKDLGWTMKPSDMRAKSQSNFGQLVIQRGGYFQFATKPEDIWG